MSAHVTAPVARPDMEPALAIVWERLQQQFALHQRSAPFWSAYQGLQQDLVRQHPHDHVRLCNAMAGLAERLGAVEHAQLLAGRHAGSTPR
ncbi:hypothetical protein [Stenotrophomonas sp. 24(2023)]|uniref:hypothetical protein n=1 Tax=Stenotrophomonas sp. 24(2023) TaxID=3068324 RepID=UPI0027DF780A|nr:hypothetical protein [Stenotrophomonas sp. 24(2023)]WMJ70533.1 hypothetical protein Q9R17_05380 [Stenotrophomonas sp. 24(2023)]